MTLRSCRLCQREPYLKASVSRLRLYVYIASVLSNDSLNCIQSEARTLSDSLRGEERVKNVAADLSRDSRSIVAYFYYDVLLLAKGSDPKHTFAVHRFDGILYKIRPDLIQLGSK